MLRRHLHSRSMSEWEYACNKSLVPDPINISYRTDESTDWSYVHRNNGAVSEEHQLSVAAYCL